MVPWLSVPFPCCHSRPPPTRPRPHFTWLAAMHEGVEKGRGVCEGGESGVKEGARCAREEGKEGEWKRGEMGLYSGGEEKCEGEGKCRY